MGKNNLVVERERLSYTMSRVFNAPRELVWKAMTDPQHMAQWWGPRQYTTLVEQMDVREGGAYRYIHTNDAGERHVFYGTFLQMVPPERLSYTFEYEPWAGHASTDTIYLEELENGKTKVTSVTTFNNIEDMEGMLQSGMEEGSTESWDRLEELLERETAR